MRARAREFPGVERIAFRGRDHRRYLVGAGTVGQQAGDQLTDLGIGEAHQPQPRHRRAVLQFGEPAPGTGVQVVLTQGGRHQHRRLAQPDRQERHQLAGGVIGPVQILQHENQRRLGGEFGKQAEHTHEPAVPRREHVAGAVIGQQPFGVCPQRVHERAVGQGRAGQWGGLPGQDLCLLGLAGQLLDQPGLADAGRAGDQQELGLARCNARIGDGQGCLLRGPAYDRRRSSHA